MDRAEYFLPVVVLNEEGEPKYLAGTAFSPAPGFLLTCRHVVDQGNHRLAIHDLLDDEVVRFDEVRYDPAERGLDLALITNPLNREPPVLPVVETSVVRPGTRVWVYGYYRRSPVRYQVDGSFFGGQVPSVYYGSQTEHGASEIALPFPIVEGTSGAPLLVDPGQPSGPQTMIGFTGVCHGSRQQRVVAQEITEVDEGGLARSEIMYRVVEFGLALHIQAIGGFLRRVGVEHLSLAR